MSTESRGRRRWLLLGGWLLLTVLVVAAFRNVAWDEARATLQGASWGWFGLAVVLNAAILVFATWQWMVFVPRNTPVSFGTMFWITAVTSTVSNGGPFLAGHATGIHLLATRGRVGYATGVSVKALDQLAEGITKLVLVATAVAASPLPGLLRGGVVGLMALVGTLGGFLVLAAHRSHHLEDLAHRWDGWPGRTAAFLSRSAAQLEALRRPRVFAGAVLLGLAQKVWEGLAIVAVLAALHVTAPAWGVLLVLAAVNLSTMMSVTPANVGIYEGSAVLAYGAMGLDPDAAVGIAVVQHLAYLIPLAGVGWATLVISGDTWEEQRSPVP